ncbi:MAG TPA: heavy-metal-associated domain-containing protein [Coriobacteriia bacterium]
MQAIHITTTGIETSDDVSLVEAVLRMLAGIADVAAVRSLRLISVLYDEQAIAPRTVLRAIRSTGYGARLLRPDGARRRSTPRVTRLANPARPDPMSCAVATWRDVPASGQSGARSIAL